MKRGFFIFLIPSIGLIANSCGKEDPFFTVDNTAPVIAEVTAVITPTNDNTPNYTFSSTESGSITFEGPCSSSNKSAGSGDNTITLSSLNDGTYSDCAITVTDKAANESNLLKLTLFEVDSTASTLVETTAIPSSTNDSTPDYTFVSSEAGTISYSGSCSSDNTSAIAGTNTITFNSLSDGTYNDCEITITDSIGNSETINIGSFVIDTTLPVVASVSPEDNSTFNSPATTVAVIFSEAMSTSTLTTNTDNTTCYGSLQLSSDNFTNCIRMSAAPSASNSDKTFTATPADNLSGGTSYKLKITTSATDNSSNSLASAYLSEGFTTTPSGSGTIKGSVKQDNGSALSGVSVSFSLYGSTVDNTTTDSDGDFSKSSLNLGIYNLTYSKSGFNDTSQSATLATDNQTLVVATLTQIVNTCSAGTITGTIRNAVSGSTVSGVNLSLRSGINVTSGTIVATATTDNSGNYSFSSISAGWYTVQTSISGYTDDKFNVYSCGNQSGQDANISTTLSGSSMRIVLRWQGSKDLDAHLEIPCTSGTCTGSNAADKSHLWYDTNQSAAANYTGVSTRDYHLYTDIVSTGDYVTLDQDNRYGSGTASRTGPETITISRIRSGTYRYHVHNYSDKGDNTTTLASSGASVAIYYNDTVTTFNVRNTAGDLWTVFDFDNSSGITAIDTMDSEGTAGNVDNH